MNDQFEKKGGKVSFETADDKDLFTDAALPWQERLRKVELMRKKIWTFRLGSYPLKIELTGGKRIKSNIDRDDF